MKYRPTQTLMPDHLARIRQPQPSDATQPNLCAALTLTQWGKLAARQRGVTLVEVLIVVAIMALIAGGVSFLVFPRWQKAQRDTAETAARTIRQVSISYRVDFPGEDCPTVSRLVETKLLDSSGHTEDPWGSPFTIACTTEDISVSSPGPDKRDGSEDDIVVGPKAAAQK